MIQPEVYVRTVEDTSLYRVDEVRFLVFGTLYREADGE